MSRAGIFEQTDQAATPLTFEEKLDLIPTHIAYRRDLNLAELQNISRAHDWAIRPS